MKRDEVFEILASSKYHSVREKEKVLNDLYAELVAVNRREEMLVEALRRVLVASRAARYDEVFNTIDVLMVAEQFCKRIGL